MNPTAPHLFISYSRKDSALMARVRDSLRGNGFTVWTDERLVPGTPEWEREIESAIKSSVGLVVLLSPSSNDSTWVRREIAFAEAFNKRIFPLLVDGDEQSAVPARLINHQRVDIRREVDYDRAVDVLLDALFAHAGIARPPAPLVQQEVPPPAAAENAAQFGQWWMPKDNPPRADSSRSEKPFDDSLSGYPLLPTIPLSDTDVEGVTVPQRVSMIETGAGTMPMRQDIALTLAVWLPMAVPFIGITLNMVPYDPILFPGIPPFAWLLTMGFVIALTFLGARLREVTPKSAGLVFLLLVGASVLLFMIAGIGTVYWFASNVFIMLLFLLPIAVAVAVPALLHYARYTQGSTKLYLGLYSFPVGCAVVGGAFGFSAGYLIMSLLDSLEQGLVGGYITSIIVAVSLYALLANRAARLRSFPRLVWILWGVAWAAVVWIYLLTGWASLLGFGY